MQSVTPLRRAEHAGPAGAASAAAPDAGSTTFAAAFAKNAATGTAFHASHPEFHDCTLRKQIQIKKLAASQPQLLRTQTHRIILHRCPSNIVPLRILTAQLRTILWLLHPIILFLPTTIIFILPSITTLPLLIQ